MVITLLDSEDVELVYAACGVLLNLMAVQDLRSLLSDNGGVKKYVCTVCAIITCVLLIYVHSYLCMCTHAHCMYVCMCIHSYVYIYALVYIHLC